MLPATSNMLPGNMLPGVNAALGVSEKMTCQAKDDMVL